MSNVYNETPRPKKPYFVLKITQVEFMLGKLKDGEILDRKRALNKIRTSVLEEKLIMLLNSIKKDTPIKNVKSAALVLNNKDNEPKIFE